MRYLLLIRPFLFDLNQIQPRTAFPCAILGVSVRLIEHNRYGLFAPVQRPEADTSTKAAVVFIKQGAELRSLEQINMVKVPEKVTDPVQPCVTTCGIKNVVEFLTKRFLGLVIDFPFFPVVFLCGIGKADPVTEGIGHTLRYQPVKEIACDLVIRRREINGLFTFRCTDPAHELHDCNVVFLFVLISITSDLVFIA